MAMLPFCGYHMADCWQHWLDMGHSIANPPKIFNVNWFRLDEDGNFNWPGLGDNLRVLEWIMKHCFNEVDAVGTPIGYQPHPNDINLEGTDISQGILKDLLNVDTDLWKQEVSGIKEFCAKFGNKLPAELSHQLSVLNGNLN